MQLWKLISYQFASSIYLSYDMQASYYLNYKSFHSTWTTNIQLLLVVWWQPVWLLSRLVLAKIVVVDCIEPKASSEN